MVGRQTVHLIEILQADAIFLGDGVHRFTGLHIVQTTFILLRRFLLFLLQPDDFSFFQLVALVALVVFGNLTITDAYLVANSLEGIAATSNNIIVLVEDADDVERGTVDLMILRALGHETVVALGIVILIELIELDNLYQFVGILRIGSIACRLQSLGPAFIVGDLETEQRTITPTGRKETGMILVRLIGRAIGTEAFAARIVIVIAGRPSPTVMTLDAKVVIGLTCEFTTPGTTLRPTGTITTCPTKRESLDSYVSPSTFPSGITS